MHIAFDARKRSDLGRYVRKVDLCGLVMYVSSISLAKIAWIILDPSHVRNLSVARVGHLHLNVFQTF